MDTSKIKQVTRARYNHRLAKLTLQEKYIAQLELNINGGQFAITPQFISYLSSETQDEVIVLDNHANPVKLNRQEILDRALEIHRRVMAEWLTESEEHSSRR